MKFIKIRGRIIPIREKGESADGFEKRMTRHDAKVGFVSGLANGHFVKKPKIRLAINALSLLSGLRTTAGRVNEHGIVKGLWEDVKSSVIKTGSGAVGGIIGLSSAVALKKVRPYTKKMGSGLGDMSFDLREKFLVKKVKNVDLSKGAKSFKTSSKRLEKIRGLIEYKK